ncbi:MAG TPA: ParB N-terminal domain-containing protein, partial [Methyloceanibacter sp.]|nr:ParB N-terminal domain-containing protein [Methyloceanibacter sp.]
MAASAQKTRLGRGLASLIGDRFDEAALGADEDRRTVPLAALKPSAFNPRRSFSEAQLEELAASIRERGLVQPIVVRPSGEGYEIVAGERRWRAAQLANLHDVPVIVRTLNDQEAVEIAII